MPVAIQRVMMLYFVVNIRSYVRFCNLRFPNILKGNRMRMLYNVPFSSQGTFVVHFMHLSVTLLRIINDLWVVSIISTRVT